MARLRRQAMMCEPVPVRSWEASSSKVTSRTPVQAVLDRPVPADEVSEPGRVGLSVGEAGDGVHRHGPPGPGAKVTGLAGDLDDLCGVREPEPADGDGHERAQFDSAVSAVASAVQFGDPMPGHPGAAGVQGGLVGFDDEHLVRVLASDEELSSSAVTSLGAPSTWRWASTARVVWSIAASR
jgi:hypothetical protein